MARIENGLFETIVLAGADDIARRAKQHFLIG